MHNKPNKSRVGHSYCNRRGHRGPEKLGQTPFAPKYHGLHRHSCGFPPLQKDIRQEIQQTGKISTEVIMTNVYEEHF